MSYRTPIFWRTAAMLCLLAFAAALAQESLQESLREEGDFYNNFGTTGYSKKEIEQQKIPYYDNFGNHIVNGYLIYGLETDRQKYFDSDENVNFLDPETKTPVSDSTVAGYSNMFQTSLMSENFNNLIMAQDGLGDMKSVILVGSQIQTRLTPLTMNKLNFQGVRWDIWTPSLKFTTLLSRTRPFIMSQNDVSGRSFIGYDRSDMRNWQGVKSGELLPDEEYITQNWGATADMFPNRRDGWILQYDKWSDFSNKSIYGDYDILLGFHGKTNIANVADVGLTYLNHHRSDIKKGEKIFSGDLPDDYAPEEIHFEIYDLTPENTNDLGAQVKSFKMRINGFDLGGLGDPSYYQSQDNYQLVSSSSNVEISGSKPLIVVFNINKAATSGQIGNLKNVKQVDFDFTVSGNYIVFVSTDKMVSYGYAAIRASAKSNDVAPDGPFTRKIEDLKNPIQAFREDVSVTTNDPVGGVHSLHVASNYGNSWFGDYIAKSPRILFAATPDDKSSHYQTTQRTYHYTYSVNTSSVTYGLDFKGKFMGVKFSGEVALNKKEYKYPGGNEVDPIYNLASYLRLDRDLVPNVLGLSGMLYNVDPQYDPALELPQVSQYYSYSRVYTKYSSLEEYGIPDYLYYPQHFNNNFHLLDANKDNDQYVESDRPIYPSDLGNGNAPNRWYADGTFSSYKASSRDDRILNRKANYINMPNKLYTFYGDDDGVYVDRFDRNHNGVADYKEDFLMYYVDPPIFSLDNDADNNDIWDVEDADNHPDMPNGIKVSYVLTADGFKSQGIRGANAKLVYTPVKNLEVTLTGLYEKAVGLDLSANTNSTQDKTSLLGNGELGYQDASGKSYALNEGFQDSRNLGIKTSGLLNVVKRSMGLEYFIGAEGQYLRDNIRNDVIRSKEVQDIEYLYVDYYYQTDEVRYRNAGLGNLIAGVTYNNIPNFLYNAKLAAGAVKRFDIPDELFWTVRTLRSRELDTTFYEYRWEPYTASLMSHVYLVNKFDYTLKFKFDYKGWKSALNVLNRLTLNPQFKFSWSYKSSDAVTDPRENFSNTAMLSDQDSTDLRLNWARYKQENENIFSSAPMLRAFFKVAEHTQLQYGYEWMRNYDRMIKTESSSRTVHTFQMYSTDNVSGYNVALIMGMNLIRDDYDVLNYDPVFDIGHSFDSKDTRFYIKIYAGN